MIEKNQTKSASICQYASIKDIGSIMYTVYTASTAHYASTANTAYTACTALNACTVAYMPTYVATPVLSLNTPSPISLYYYFGLRCNKWRGLDWVSG